MEKYANEAEEKLLKKVRKDFNNGNIKLHGVAKFFTLDDVLIASDYPEKGYFFAATRASSISSLDHRDASYYVAYGIARSQEKAFRFMMADYANKLLLEENELKDKTKS